MPRQPPLNALRVFEAAARHMSFKDAANELNVTPGAVGHQIKALEDYLGTPLFRRFNRNLRLTEAGQACLPEVKEGFVMLSRAVERVKLNQPSASLVVSAAPAFAVKWLVPRLHKFLEAYPETDVRIQTTTRVVDLANEGIDIGIRFGSGNFPGHRADLLFHEEVSPVCSPALGRGQHPVLEPADLRSHPLIHLVGETDDLSWPDWPAWLQEAKVTGVDPTAGPHFNQTITAVQAAIESQGVALIGYMCIADEISSGQLIKPFGENLSTRTAYSYYVVCPQSKKYKSEVSVFYEWLLSEVEEDSLRTALR